MASCPIKFSMAIRPEADDEELQFAAQLGVPCVYTWVRREQRTAAYLTKLREKVESYGLELYMTGSYDLGKSDRIHLALPGRDHDITELQAFVRALGAAGIPAVIIAARGFISRSPPVPSSSCISIPARAAINAKKPEVRGSMSRIETSTNSPIPGTATATLLERDLNLPISRCLYHRSGVCGGRIPPAPAEGAPCGNRAIAHL